MGGALAMIIGKVLASERPGVCADASSRSVRTSLGLSHNVLNGEPVEPSDKKWRSLLSQMRR